MRIAYLESALRDLARWRTYYGSVFPAGRPEANERYLKVITLLKDNPRLGNPTDEPGVFEFSLPHTPFSLIYRIVDDTIEILRVWDQRQERPEQWNP